MAVGRELGLAEPDLLDLEYAALMHDIGQLALPDPIPGGATVLVSRQDQRRIAELGADVIRKAGVLDQVAELVRCQSWPYRGHDPEPPVGSRIIRAANAFDDLVGGSTDRDRSAAALERLRLDRGRVRPGRGRGAHRGRREAPGRPPGVGCPACSSRCWSPTAARSRAGSSAPLRRMGIRAVAVYSEADAGLPYVREADEAVPIGAAPPR